MITVTGSTRAQDPLPVMVGPHRTPRHEYYFNGAGPWPGVTSITDVLDKPALVRWKREQVALAAIGSLDWLVANRTKPQDELVATLLAVRNKGDLGRERGSRIHAVLEAVLQRHPVNVEERDVAAVNGARAWLNENHVRPLEVEALLIHETLGYGGTCDLIAEIDGVTWLLDWKTSRSVAWPNTGRVYSDLRLQLVAYRNAEFVARPGDPTRHPLPAIARCGILHVTDEGTKLYPADPSDEDWATFRACLWIHGWKARS